MRVKEREVNREDRECELWISSENLFGNVFERERERERERD